MPGVFAEYYFLRSWLKIRNLVHPPMKKTLAIVLLLFCFPAVAQEDTLSSRLNTIKLDITTRWLYRDAYVLTYERVINAKRSWGVIAGYQKLPEARILGPNVNVTRDTRASGFKLGAEYRFYLAKENKFKAPHGVYLGPYVSFNNFHNEREISVNTSGGPEAAVLNANFNILNIGVQLGYQFVFNDRWTIDLSFLGPAVSNYRATLDLTGNYTFNPDDITNEILKDLINRFPGLGDLLGGATLASNGRLDTWAAGFRYQLQVGYRFGKKRK